MNSGVALFIILVVGGYAIAFYIDHRKSKHRTEMRKWLMSKGDYERASHYLRIDDVDYSEDKEEIEAHLGRKID